MSQVVALCVDYPGTIRVLEEGEKLKLWTFYRIGHNEIVIPPRTQTLLLGAWHSIYDDLLNILLPKLKEESPQVRIGVVWTSSLGEMEFVKPIEHESLQRLLEDDRIDFIWFGDKVLADSFPAKGFYAPYPFHLPPIGQPPSPKEEIMTLFCPDSPKKNILNQLVAASIIQQTYPELVLVTNVEVPSFIATKLKYRGTGWLPQDEYNKVLASSRLNLACSWAETLNYQAVEAVMLGTPSIGTSSIPWLPERFWVPAPNDPASIASVAMQILDGSLLMRSDGGYVRGGVAITLSDKPPIELLQQEVSAFFTDSNQRLVTILKERGII